MQKEEIFVCTYIYIYIYVCVCVCLLEKELESNDSHGDGNSSWRSLIQKSKLEKESPASNLWLVGILWHQAGFDTNSFYSGNLGEGKFGHELKLMPCWTMLVIGSLGAMWIMLVFAKSPDIKPGDLAGHRFTRLRGPVLCESMIDTLPGIYAWWPAKAGYPRSKLLIQVNIKVKRSYSEIKPAVCIDTSFLAMLLTVL